MNTIKNELAALFWCFWRYRSKEAYNVIHTRFREHPECFNDDKTMILGGRWKSAEAQQQALWGNLNNTYGKPLDIRTLKTHQTKQL